MELALVVLILGILAAGTVRPLRAGLDQAHRARVARDLVSARQALLGYAASHERPRLPCPDCRRAGCATGDNRAGDGIEDRAADPLRCDAGSDQGLVPWVTLGLGSADPWGNRYAYRVAPAFAAGFDLDTGSDGSARVLTRDGRDRLQTLAGGVPVVIWSHGPNGLGATGADGRTRRAPAEGSDEAENLDRDRLLVSLPPGPPGSGGFDDILAWINAYELKYLLLRAGRLP